MNDDTTVRIERLVDAPIEVLFRAWTTREAMEHWYRERADYHVHVAELDPRVGGSYRVEFGPEGGTFVETGTYLEIDAPRRLVMTESLEGPDGPALRDSIAEENPAGTPIKINGRYPDAVPMSTMPPDILAALPQLPEELEYRFVGDRLVLLDTKAHLIIDYVDDALPG